MHRVSRGHCREGHDRDRICVPAVLLRECHSTPGQLALTLDGADARDEGQVTEANDLDSWLCNVTGQLNRTLQVALGIDESIRPQLDDAQVHQGERAGVGADGHFGLGRRINLLDQRISLTADGAEVAAPRRKREVDGGQTDLQTGPPVLADDRCAALCDRQVCGRIVQ